MKKITFYSIIFLAGLIFIFQYSCIKETGPLPTLPTTPSQSFCDSANVKFGADINPIIQANCAISSCHNTATMQNGIDFSIGYAAIDTARIRARVIDGAINGWMPNTGPLPLLERQKIECWLKAGAPNN